MCDKLSSVQRKNKYIIKVKIKYMKATVHAHFALVDIRIRKAYLFVSAAAVQPPFLDRLLILNIFKQIFFIEILSAGNP